LQQRCWDASWNGTARICDLPTATRRTSLSIRHIDKAGHCNRGERSCSKCVLQIFRQMPMHRLRHEGPNRNSLLHFEHLVSDTSNLFGLLLCIILSGYWHRKVLCELIILIQNFCFICNPSDSRLANPLFRSRQMGASYGMDKEGFSGATRPCEPLMVAYVEV